MSSLEQVKENLAIANEGYPNILTNEEKNIINEVGRTYRGKKNINCTQRN